MQPTTFTALVAYSRTLLSPEATLFPPPRPVAADPQASLVAVRGLTGWARVSPRLTTFPGDFARSLAEALDDGRSLPTTTGEALGAESDPLSERVARCAAEVILGLPVDPLAHARLVAEVAQFVDRSDSLDELYWAAPSATPAARRCIGSRLLGLARALARGEGGAL